MGKKQKNIDLSSEEIIVLQQGSNCNGSNSYSNTNSRPTFETEQTVKNNTPKMKVNKTKKIILSTVVALISIFIIHRLF